MTHGRTEADRGAAGGRSYQSLGTPGSDQHAALIAAQQQTEYAFVAILISAVGTVLVISTVAISIYNSLLSRTATKAAMEALDDARAKTQMEMRPYMTCKLLRPNRVYRGSEERTVARSVSFFWTNNGKTPAINIDSRSSFHVSDEQDLGDDFPFPDWTDRSRGVGVVGPGESIAVSTETIPFADLSDAIKGRRYIHVYSWIEYEALDHAIRYRTESHYLLVVAGTDPAEKNGLSMRFLIDRGFSGIDDTCSRRASPAWPRRGAG